MFHTDFIQVSYDFSKTVVTTCTILNEILTYPFKNKTSGTRVDSYKSVVNKDVVTGSVMLSITGAELRRR